ncbi:MAG TPA: hypothetical protein VGF17_06810 [Phytomonospora sp.]
MNPDDLADAVESAATRLDALRRSGAIFWIDLLGPVETGPNRLKTADALYGGRTLVTGLDALGESWTRAFTRTGRTMGAFEGLFPKRAQRAEPEFLLSWIVLLVEDTLGPVRSAWRVRHRPKSWYAAIWNDFLLIGDEQAVVLSLTNDS